MQNYLVFRLYGPLAAWGEIAVGEVRRATSYPSRSAIMGLISAALGISRDKSDELSAIYKGYDVAFKVQSIGTSFTDFHTISVPTGKMPRYVVTRKDEIDLFVQQSKSEAKTSRPNPILSFRRYFCDTLNIVAIRTRNNAPYTLEIIKEKLIRPKFVLYLGRKSCPVSVPLKPQVVSKQGFKCALDETPFPPLVTSFKDADITGYFIPFIKPHYYWENDAEDMVPNQTHERYDEPLNRMRWQFAPRKEHMMVEGGGQ